MAKVNAKAVAKRYTKTARAILSALEGKGCAPVSECYVLASEHGHAWIVFPDAPKATMGAIRAACGSTPALEYFDDEILDSELHFSSSGVCKLRPSVPSRWVIERPYDTPNPLYLDGRRVDFQAVWVRYIPGKV